MPYEINPTCYRQVFVIPKEVVDKHIKLAGALQLKVLLWFCCHQGILDDPQAIARDLGAAASDVQDALQYWIVNGMIRETGEAAPSEQPADTRDVPPVSAGSALPTPPARAQKPNRAEVARRGKESPEVSWLLCEAQNKFNRTLSFAESSTLVWIMDTYGLPAAVILMIIEYSASMERCNIRYIETTAVRWAKEEIDTVAKAEKYLTELEQSRNEWHTVCRLFGLDKRKPSKQEEIYTARWLREWKFSASMLQAAYDQCVNNTGKVSFPYINKVLEQWHKAGYQKPEEIAEKPEPAKAAGKGLRRASQEKSKSYSMEDIENLL